MLKVELEINNNTAHSCSPIEFLKRYIIQDAEYTVQDMSLKPNKSVVFNNPYAKITVKKIEQI